MRQNESPSHACEDFTRSSHIVKGSWSAREAIRTGSAAMIDTADWVLTRLPEMGVPIPHSSRLPAARALIARIQAEYEVSGSTNADSSRQEEIAEAHRTIVEFYLIVRAIRSRRALWDAELRRKVVTMLGGHVLEGQDTNPIHRNTQFEMYVLAMLLMGRATIRLGEPDLVLRYGLADVGIAIKRLRSPKQLRRRVLEAADQIETSGRPGFIAVNYDLYASDVGGPREVEDVANRGVRLEKALSPVYQLMGEFENRPAVLGLMNFAYSVHWENDANPPRIASAFFRQVIRFSDSPADVSLAGEFFGTLGARIDNALREL